MVGAHQDKESTAQQPAIVEVVVADDDDDEIYQAADREGEKGETNRRAHVLAAFYHWHNRIIVRHNLRSDTASFVLLVLLLQVSF